MTSPDTTAQARACDADLRSAQADIEARYRSATPRSACLYEAAHDVLPGGITRHGVYRYPYPIYVKRASGSVLTDADGRAVVDFCFNATALAVGHAHPLVEAAIAAQAARGTAYFSPSTAEIELARVIVHRLPSADQVVFCNSGGEAVMLALRLARAFTGRPCIAKFEGSFHGSHDDVLWSVTPSPGSLTVPVPTPVPASPGIAGHVPPPLVLPFNDRETTVALIDRHAAHLAAVIVEPLAGRMGLVEAEPAFLEALLRVCERHGILVIFDEILSLRTGPGGMQGRLTVRPDITALGKIIGGGLPVGAVAGRADVMALFDPTRDGHLYHTGTFAANPLTLAAGLATMSLLTSRVFDELEQAGTAVRAALREICAGLPLQVTGIGSLFKVSATPRPLRRYTDTAGVDSLWQSIVSLDLLTEGYFLTPQLQGCVATTTTVAQMEGFLRAFSTVLQRWPVAAGASHA